MNGSPQTNRRLALTFLHSLTIQFGGGKMLIDCYNDAVYSDIAPTLTTGIDFRNYHYIVEIYQVSASTSG